MLWDVGGPGSLIVGEDVPDAVPGASLGSGGKGEHGCGCVGAMGSGDADGLALGSDLEHRVEGCVVLLSCVEWEWRLNASLGAVEQELLQALLADNAVIDLRSGGSEGGAECGEHVCGCVFECVQVLSYLVYTSFLVVNFDSRLGLLD